MPREEATMNGNEKPVLATPAHEKPPTTPGSMTEGTPRSKSTREARLLSELRAAALTVSPGRTAFVTVASTRGWFRVTRLDALTARVSHVAEAVVVETLIEDAAFLDAEPLGEVA
jgi:hypothetical protein